MNQIRIAATAAALFLITATGVPAQSQPRVTVYKDPTCGCCSKWVDHLRMHGFDATATNVTSIDDIKTKNRVPQQTRSCHTAIVGGYVIEGHVPAVDVQRLLKQKPAGIIGLAVPGMPLGSPGMEVPGGQTQNYNVLAFDKAGRTSVFASH
jgi:hypothetical protein